MYNKLKGKKVFFIGPVFYNYHWEIVKTLQEFGAEVKFYPENLNYLIRIVARRVSPRLLLFLTRLYGKKIHKIALAFEPDYIFVIRGGDLGYDFFHRLRLSLKNTRFVMYQWDSLKNHSYYDCISCFDKVFSFDREDTLNHSMISYLPLFYLKEIAAARSDSNKIFKYDIVFIGEYNHYRYSVIEKLAKSFDEEGISYLFYLKIKPFVFFRLLTQNFKRYRWLIFKYLKKARLLDIYKNTGTILDIPSNLQSGLTMRTIETFGAHKKLITLNRNIIYEPVYNKEIIEIMDDISDKKRIITFIKSIASEYPDIEKYSLPNWLKAIFS